jgi:hypothetical protein
MTTSQASCPAEELARRPSRARVLHSPRPDGMDGAGVTAVADLRGMTVRGAFSVLLALLVVGAEVPALHHHQSRDPALYDEECPLARLAANTRTLATAHGPHTDPGAPLAASEILPMPPAPRTVGAPIGTTEARAPPTSS